MECFLSNFPSNPGNLLSLSAPSWHLCVGTRSDRKSLVCRDPSSWPPQSCQRSSLPILPPVCWRAGARVSVGFVCTPPPRAHAHRSALLVGSLLGRLSSCILRSDSQIFHFGESSPLKYWGLSGRQQPKTWLGLIQGFVDPLSFGEEDPRYNNLAGLSCHFEHWVLSESSCPGILTPTPLFYRHRSTSQGEWAAGPSGQEGCHLQPRAPPPHPAPPEPQLGPKLTLVSP